MYDELIKRLREHGEYLIISDRMKAPPNVNVRNVFAEDYAQAADAIEKLLQKVQQLPRWIPVTERLPEERINQNTLDFEYVLCATTFGDVRPYKYGRKIGQREAHFWNGAGYVDAYVTHWMPLPEPQKEG